MEENKEQQKLEEVDKEIKKDGEGGNKNNGGEY